MADDWLIVPNWQRFQHYGNRNPVWIKLYTELNSDDKWLGLSLSERGLLATVWLEFCRSNGQVRLENVRRLCGSSARGSHIEALVDAGLLRVSASKPPPIRASASRAHEETETDKEKVKDVKAVGKGRATASEATKWGLDSEAMGYALRLASVCDDKDDQTVNVITSYVGKLPPAGFETVREKILEGNGSIRSHSGYAVSELGRMVKERTYT